MIGTIILAILSIASVLLAAVMINDYLREFLYKKRAKK